MNMPAVDIFFYAFAVIGSLFALRVVTASNPITSAFSLVMTFFCVAAIYALMQAHFIAAIQILVYAGAVTVLFAFVIMLLNADVKESSNTKSIVGQFLGLSVCGLLFVGFNWLVRNGNVTTSRGNFSAQQIEGMGGNSRVLSEVLFSDYILPFELTSVLLLIGIVGSVALAKRVKRGGSKV
jgi:NADH-quinone oxidoreductase subunit J